MVNGKRVSAVHPLLEHTWMIKSISRIPGQLHDPEQMNHSTLLVQDFVLMGSMEILTF